MEKPEYFEPEMETEQEEKQITPNEDLANELRVQIKEAEIADNEEAVLSLEQELRNIETDSRSIEVKKNEEGDIAETNQEVIAKIEKEQILLTQESKKISQNQETINSFDVKTLAKNEVALDELGDKVTGIFNKITEKLSKMETAKLVLPGVLVGIAAAAINVAGVSELSTYVSYLPDTIQHFISSPDSAGNILWSVLNRAGDGFSMPSIDNYAAQVQHAGDIFMSQGAHVENASRAASGFINVATGMAISMASLGVGNVIKTWAKAKEKLKKN